MDEQHNSTRPSASTPETVEVNVVMGAQTRAIVRSALIHVRNYIKDSGIKSPAVRADVLDTIDLELSKWPLGGEAEDTLDQWLFKRFGRGVDWDVIAEEDKAYWEHEAAAVRRAVGRGGFKTSPEEVEITTPVSELQHAHATSGDEIKGYVQLDLKNAESLGEAIRIAVGAASMTWTNMSGAGTFRSEVALDIATQLEHHVQFFIKLAMGQVGQRHQALVERLQAYRNAGHPTVSIQQVYQLITGTATPEEYESALQVRPMSAQERTRG